MYSNNLGRLETMLPNMKQVCQNNLKRLVSGLPDKKQGWQTRNESASQTCFETGSFEMNLPDQFLVFLELQGLDAKEPHKKFVEKLSRDFLVHGMVPYYPASEIRTRSDTISQKTGRTRTAEDLLTVSKADEPDQVMDVHTLLNRIHALFMALEYLNICGYSRAAGPLRYMQELEQFRIDCPGLPADSLIRKKIYRLQSEQRETYGSFQEALLEVINNHKYLWNDARTKAVLAKVERKEHDPVREPDQVQQSDSPAKSSPNKARGSELETRSS